MKRLLTLALIASLMSAPAALAQPTTTPIKPAPAPTSPTPSAKTPAQPKKDDKPAKPAGADAATKAWDDAAKTGPNHKLLEWFEGEWAAEVKDLTSGSEATDKGTMTSKMAMGGRFLMMDFDGRSHGKFFRGAGMMGYNNTDKRFESVWSDSQGTSITFLTGSVDKDGKVFTFSGDMSDPTTGGRSATREVTTITGKDTYHSDFYMTMGGKEVKAMEINYTKIKAAEKDDKAAETPKTK